jgi:hypothetical protein
VQKLIPRHDPLFARCYTLDALLKEYLLYRRSRKDLDDTLYMIINSCISTSLKMVQYFVPVRYTQLGILIFL